MALPEQTLAELVYADHSERGKLRFTGEQAAWFLHQVLTQSLEDIAPGEARDAAMITAHGRMIGYLEIIATEDALWAHYEPELREVFPAELQRYVFATRVTIEELSDDFGLVLVAGPGLDAALERLPSEYLVQPTNALGERAAHVWVIRDAVEVFEKELETLGFRRADDDELESLRISNGVPRWGREMDAKTFPQEVGVDVTAVHYDKGCYLGQEAMAKINFRGKVNRRLAHLESTTHLEPGVDLEAEGKKVGVVTSSAGDRALAMVRFDLVAGSVVRAGELDVKVVS